MNSELYPLPTNLKPSIAPELTNSKPLHALFTYSWRIASPE